MSRPATFEAALGERRGNPAVPQARSSTCPPAGSCSARNAVSRSVRSGSTVVASSSHSSVSKNVSNQATSTELLARERAKALARGVVGPDRLVVRSARVGGDLFRDRAHLAHDGVVVLRLAQQRLDPGVVARV
jgi:hypothetical protein